MNEILQQRYMTDCIESTAKFHCKAFLKIHEYASADDFEDKVFKQRDVL